MVRSIAVVSLGGSVGKTTLAVNLALALHELNHKVLLFDADFTKDNMLEHLGIHSPGASLDSVYSGEAHINDAIYKHLTGLKIIPSRRHSYDDFSYHYQDLLADNDYIIIDAPSGIEALYHVLPSADEAIIIHDPKYSTKIVADAIKLLDELKVVNLGILLNNFSENSTDTVQQYHVIEKIPPSETIKKSFKLKNPVVHTHPKSHAAKKFRKLAKKLE